MTDADVIEYLARKSLETTEERDQLEANIDRDLEQLTASVQERAEAIADAHVKGDTDVVDDTQLHTILRKRPGRKRLATGGASKKPSRAKNRRRAN